MAPKKPSETIGMSVGAALSFLIAGGAMAQDAGKTLPTVKGFGTTQTLAPERWEEDPEIVTKNILQGGASELQSCFGEVVEENLRPGGKFVVARTNIRGREEDLFSSKGENGRFSLGVDDEGTARLEIQKGTGDGEAIAKTEFDAKNLPRDDDFFVFGKSGAGKDAVLKAAKEFYRKLQARCGIHFTS